jgi:hypothetical protein
MGFTRMLHGPTFSCPGSAKWLYKLIDGWMPAPLNVVRAGLYGSAFKPSTHFSYF